MVITQEMTRLSKRPQLDLLFLCVFFFSLQIIDNSQISLPSLKHLNAQ